jgi:hypothetical protein
MYLLDIAVSLRIAAAFTVGISVTVICFEFDTFESPYGVCAL